MTIKSSVVLTGLVAAFFVFAGCGRHEAKAAADPQAAMLNHIKEKTTGGVYPIFDGQTGQLMNLEFKKLHSKVKDKSGFAVSCADFTDKAGNKIDVDFVVQDTGDGFVVADAWLHKLNKVKRPYKVTATP